MNVGPGSHLRRERSNIKAPPYVGITFSSLTVGHKQHQQIIKWDLLTWPSLGPSIHQKSHTCRAPLNGVRLRCRRLGDATVTHSHRHVTRTKNFGPQSHEFKINLAPPHSFQRKLVNKVCWDNFLRGETCFSPWWGRKPLKPQDILEKPEMESQLTCVWHQALNYFFPQ